MVTRDGSVLQHVPIRDPRLVLRRAGGETIHEGLWQSLEASIFDHGLYLTVLPSRRTG